MDAPAVRAAERVVLLALCAKVALSARHADLELRPEPAGILL
jgi:hypothetical protein